ncbi:MAG: hypothetical protein V4529_03195 [Gemmatimonadota bacterium]
MRTPIAVVVLLMCLAPMQVADAQDTVSTPQPSGPVIPQVRAMLFGDASYVATDRKIPSGFELGQLVGHIIVSFNDRLNYFGEFSATAQPTGYAFEVERSILRYDFSDAVKLSVGRYHTPVGYWNTTFHHGTWLQTTVSRPEMIKFGSQLIPTHFVGAFVEGNIPSEDLGLQYSAGVGNGRGSVISRGGDAGDVNGNRAWTLAVSAHPAALFGMQVGADYYHDRVSEASGPESTEGISSAYIAWQRERPEFIAEYVMIDHTPVTGGATTHNHAGYAQLAYRLTGAAHQWKPYIRAERTDIAAGDVVFAPLALGYDGGIAGVRYDFTSFAALKAEYRRERFETHDWSNGAYVQASFTVPDLGGGDHNPMQP